MSNKFFSFINPYLSFIDKGNIYQKPFSWLYSLFGILNLIFPLLVLYNAIDSGLFSGPAKFTIVFALLWIVIAFAGWLSFQLWWSRKSKLSFITAEGDDFIATPVVSHLVQTMGEWLGTWIGVVGFFGALLTTLFLGSDANRFSYQIGVPMIETGFMAIVIMPITGFLIIVVSRFAAEQFRALTAIANNTKKN